MAVALDAQATCGVPASNLWPKFTPTPEQREAIQDTIRAPSGVTEVDRG